MKFDAPGGGLSHLGRGRDVLLRRLVVWLVVVADVVVLVRHHEDALQLGVHQLARVGLLPLLKKVQWVCYIYMLHCYSLLAYQGVLVDVSLRREHGLDHELVPVLLRRIKLERLETDCKGIVCKEKMDETRGFSFLKCLTWNLHCLPRIDDSRVGLDAVPLWRRRLDLEADLHVWRVRQLHYGGHSRGEGAWKLLRTYEGYGTRLIQVVQYRFAYPCFPISYSP